MPPTTSQKIFISHDSYDGLAATVMKDVLGRAGVGLTFLDRDDIRPGDDWQDRIKDALNDCDAVVTLLSPEFSKKPWMAAEWACFWAKDKPTYVLRLETSLEAVFGPMRRTQIADLTSITSMTAFLDQIAEDNLDNFSLAKRLVDRVGQARTEQAVTWAEAQLDRIVRKEGVVSSTTIENLVSAGLSVKLRDLYLRVDEPGSHLTAPRVFHICQALYAGGLNSAELLPLALVIRNSNYQRDLSKSVISSGEPADDKRRFLDALFPHLTEVARSKIVSHAQTQDLPLSALWAKVKPFGADAD